MQMDRGRRAPLDILLGGIRFAIATGRGGPQVPDSPTTSIRTPPPRSWLPSRHNQDARAQRPCLSPAPPITAAWRGEVASSEPHRTAVDRDVWFQWVALRNAKGCAHRPYACCEQLHTVKLWLYCGFTTGIRLQKLSVLEMCTW